MQLSKKLKSSVIAGASILAMSAGIAQAGVVEFSDLTASWIDIDPASIVAAGNGTDFASMRWGTPAGSGLQSGYDFHTAATPFSVILPPSPSADFDLGTWTHLNYPITGTTLSTATLKLDAVIEVDGISVGTKSFFFDFAHNETNNGDAICANGQSNGVGVNLNGCADLVDISFSTLSENFLVGDDYYTLNIISDTSSFETMENALNTFTIKGNLSLDTRTVSESGSLALLTIGLLGLGYRARKNS